MPATRAQVLNVSEWAREASKNIDQCLILDRSVPAEHGDCWLWLGYRRPNGYGRMTVNRKSFYAHRYAFFAFHGFHPPSNVDVCHKCDTRLCVNPDHLFLGSRLDNMRDAKNKGRLSIGPKHGEAVRNGKRKSNG